MKKKILFGITSLTLGGAERVLVDLVNKLLDKYDITIFTIYSKGELEKQLSEKVKIKSLCDKSYSELSNFKKHFVMPFKILLLKKRIYNKKIKEDYNTEIAFLEGPITRLFSSKNKNIKKIAWIHNDISLVFGNGFKAKIKRIIDKKIYSKYDNLIFVSKENLDNFNKTYKKLNSVKKEIIYNYIDKEKVIEKSKENNNINFDKETVNLITVARLVPQKAIDRLIEVHNKLIKEGLLYHFYIIGDGPEKEKLQELIKNFKLEDTFHLLGKKENPYPYIKEADYFCLLSNFEGYGMVLEEAKILNKRILITNTAAREAVINYKDSKILDNTEKGIYEGIKEILTNKKEKSNISNDKTIEYDNSNIIGQVIDVIEN